MKTNIVISDLQINIDPQIDNEQFDNSINYKERLWNNTPWDDEYLDYKKFISPVGFPIYLTEMQYFGVDGCIDRQNRGIQYTKLNTRNRELSFKL